jgi:hypothetical protein
VLARDGAQLLCTLERFPTFVIERGSIRLDPRDPRLLLVAPLRLDPRHRRRIELVVGVLRGRERLDRASRRICRGDPGRAQTTEPMRRRLMHVHARALGRHHIRERGAADPQLGTVVEANAADVVGERIAGDCSQGR